MEKQLGNILVCTRFGKERTFVLVTGQGNRELKSTDEEMRRSHPSLMNLVELIEEPDFEIPE